MGPIFDLGYLGMTDNPSQKEEDGTRYPWRQGWHPWIHKGHKEYYAAVGYLCHQWNTVESLYSHLASDIMGFQDYKKHDIIFRHFGIVSIGEFMLEYADAHIPFEDAKLQLRHVVSYVNVCRINRNTIVHGFPEIGFDSADINFRSSPDNKRPKAREFKISIQDVQNTCDSCETAGLLAIRVPFLLTEQSRKLAKTQFAGKWNSLLLAKPPLPKQLGPENPQILAKRERQQKSSSGKISGR